MKNARLTRLVPAALALLALAACRPAGPSGWQGYLEGEFVHLAAPLGGRLERLAVARGGQVAAGDPLFTLEQAAVQATLREAGERLRSAEARLADLRLGLRPTEIAALEARLAQARSAADLSQRELDRLNPLFRAGAIPEGELDRGRLGHERNARAVEELAAQLATARLGGRADLVAAAQAEAAAAAAARDRAQWAVAEKTQAAPRAGLVFDTLYRDGEFVPAGAPVVSLLPPENLRVRFFVPEPAFASLRPGATVRVTLAGRAQPLEARITYLSPRPEYTPPVLYNRDNRAKLVFMVEAAFDPATARTLNPGLPVDVHPVP
jgi:HlyD family secretion protein